VIWSGVLAPELVAITAANAVAAIFRFSVLRAWVFRSRAVTNPAPTLEVSR
jgi:putative flippase GtrA